MRFLNTLYPDPPEGTYLVVSWLSGGELHSQWIKAVHLDKAARIITTKARQCDVYIGVGLRTPRREPTKRGRGTSSDVHTIPALWVEFDHSGGVHKATNLPTPEELLVFIGGLPFSFSLLVDSTGGIHAYLLFRELWILDTSEERQRAQTLLRRFQRTIQAWTAERGWKVDSTADLARILRPAGTYNWKSGVPKAVTIQHEDAIRYNPSEIEEASWLLEIEESRSTSAPAPTHAFLPTQLELILQGCAWMRHCKEDVRTLSEPEWYHSLTIVRRCENGEALTHEWSENYPQYDPNETSVKAQHAVEDAPGPTTCRYIRAQLSGELYCQTCAHWGKITSPIVLGMRHKGILPGPEPTDSFACPELPKEAQMDETLAADASRWLDTYIAFSKTWAPRGYEGFHETVGVWVLETTAARRLKIPLGLRGLYTSNYHALAARTTLFTKTTVVAVGLEVLNAAGLGFLLAADESTPQALLRSLTLKDMPELYDDLPEPERQWVRVRLAFAAQRGWFYEEFGQHLTAMMRKDSVMADFRGLLRKLDDHKERYEVQTISRGVDALLKPYLTLLANLTPADLKPFVQLDSALWRDGFLARFTFDTPPSDAVSDARFPTEPLHARLFNTLAPPLAAWHQRLGLPEVRLQPICDKKGTPTGKYMVEVIKALPEHTITLGDGVLDAFYRYESALRALLRHSNREYLDGSYGRLPIKALRVAALLGSLENKNVVELWHWCRGQQMAERWREGLRRLMQQVQREEPTPSKARLLEERILKLLTRGEMTVRELKQNIWGASTEEIRAALEALKSTGEIEEVQHANKGRPTMKYRIAEGGVS